MKCLAIIFFIFFTISTTAQELLEKVLVTEIGQNDTLCYKIANLNDLPISFYPKVAHLPGGEYITYSDDSLYAWLNRQVTLQGEDAKLQMIHAIAYVIKSPRFVNRLGIYDHGTHNTEHKKFSPIGWFSNYHAQCGDYMKYAQSLFHWAYNIPAGELRECSIPDEHTLGEIMYQGRWTKVDFDPGTPSLMTLNSASSNGFASITDIATDTSLLQEANRYLYADTLDLCPWFQMSEHRENFVGGTQFYNAGIYNGLDVEGTWTLCSGCTLEWITPLNNDLVYMDPNTPEYQEGYNLFVQYQITGDLTYYLEAISLLADYLGITNEEAQILIEQDLLTDEEISMDLILSERYGTVAPTILLRIPPTTEELEIGRYGDLHLPFLVTSVSTAGTVRLLDTIIGSDGFNIELWNEDSVGYAEAYAAQNSELNYLTEGWIYSPNGETLIELAFNPAIYPIGQVDIELHGVSFPGTLLIEARICNGDSDIITSIDENITVDKALLVYPNPTNGNFIVMFDNILLSDYVVIDMQGRKIQSNNMKPGIYLIQAKCNDSFFVEKLVVQ